MWARTLLVLVACIRSRRGWPHRVDLGLAQSVEDLPVEQLIAKAGVEALDVAVIRYVGRRCLTCSADLRGLAYGATIRDMGTGST